MEKMDVVNGNSKQVVVFKLKEEEFGIDINNVREVLKMLPVTSLPHSDHSIEGVINIRGSIIPVVNLCRRLDLPELSLTDDTRIIVVEIEDEPMGLIVDKVTEVLNLSLNDIQQASSGVMGVNTSFLDGVANLENRLVLLLGVGNLLSSNDSELMAAAVNA